MALRSPELALRGISTTFGNTKGETALQVARQVIRQLGGASQSNRTPPIYKGSHSSGSPEWKSTQASEAMASVLRQEKLTIIAQGPLTNIATVIINHPDVVRNVERIVMVAGKRPGNLFHPGEQWWFHFRDFNIRKDTPAAKIVLDSGIPLILTPFELATKVTIMRSDLDKLGSGDEAAHWLRQASQSWMSFWEYRLHKQDSIPLMRWQLATSPCLTCLAVRFYPHALVLVYFSNRLVSVTIWKWHRILKGHKYITAPMLIDDLKTV